MEQKDAKLIDELKTKSSEAADRIDELSDDLETVESERDEMSGALQEISGIADEINEENWEQKKSEIIEKVKEVL